MSETSNYSTTSYDALIVEDWKFGGGIFTISIDNCRNECFKPLFKTEMNICSELKNKEIKIMAYKSVPE